MAARTSVGEDTALSDESDFPRLVSSIVILVLFGAVFLVKNCTDSQHPRLTQTLLLQGYKNVQLGAYSFGCADSVCRSFSAEGPAGKPVKGSVGCGYFLKGCTVRLEP